MDFLKEGAKTFAAFAATLALNMVTSLINGSTPWPQNSAEWVQYLLTSFGAALAVYTARNKVTEKQIEKAIVKGDVTPAAVSVVADNTAPAKVPTPAPVEIGPPVVEPVAEHIPQHEAPEPTGDLVDQVVQDAQQRNDI